VQAFREAIEARDLEALLALFSDDVVFRSPVVFSPYRGPDQVAPLLSAVAEVMEDFRYTREMGSTDAADHGLVFEARIGDRQVEGCDFIHTGPDGKIDELYVMLRPASGLMALAQAMSRQLGLDDAAAPSEATAT
jgi:ketosteroid isomerase-like protein